MAIGGVPSTIIPGAVPGFLPEVNQPEIVAVQPTAPPKPVIVMQAVNRANTY